LIIILNTI